MLVTLVTAGLAIVGTLLGSIVSGQLALRAAERTAHLNHGQTTRCERLEAVTTLASAADEHRMAMWKRGDAALKGLPGERIEALHDASHLMRSAVSRPLVALRVLIADRAVRAAADEMITLTYAMREAYGTR